MAIDGISAALSSTALNVPRANPIAATAASAASAALDARQQGVVDRAALQTALSSTVVPTSKTAPDPTLAQALDRNGNGTVTTEELTAQTQSLADQLFSNLRQVAEPRTPVSLVAPQAPLSQTPGQKSQTAPASASNAAASSAAAAASSTSQLGNPGRVVALMNLMDLVSAYGPSGEPGTPTLPSGKTVDVSA